MCQQSVARLAATNFDGDADPSLTGGGGGSGGMAPAAARPPSRVDVHRSGRLSLFHGGAGVGGLALEGLLLVPPPGRDSRGGEESFSDGNGPIASSSRPGSTATLRPGSLLSLGVPPWPGAAGYSAAYAEASVSLWRRGGGGGSGISKKSRPTSSGMIMLHELAPAATAARRPMAAPRPQTAAMAQSGGPGGLGVEVPSLSRQQQAPQCLADLCPQGHSYPQCKGRAPGGPLAGWCCWQQ